MIYVFTVLLILMLNISLRPNQYQNNITGIKYGKNRLNYCLIVGFWLFLLLVLRHDYVGTDTQNYHFLYDCLADGNFSTSLENVSISSEYGFYILNHVLASNGLPFRCLLIISAALYVGAISYLIYKYSQKPCLSYFIFLTYGFFIFNTTMRQCFALSFCIIALVLSINKKITLSLLFCLVACLFHSTAIVFLPVYFITRLEYDKRSYLLVLAVGVFMALFSSVIFKYGIELSDKNYKEVATGGYGTLLLMSLVATLGFFYRKQLPPTNKYWLFLLLIGICLFPVAQFHPALFRINMYYRIFIVIYIANILNLKTQITNLIYPLIILIGLYQFTIGNKNAGIRTFPYVFFWEDYREINPEINKLNLK